MNEPYVRLILPILGILALSSCTYGRFGTLVARRTMTTTAEVIDAYGFGAQLRPGGVDGGFTFGWRHTTYIYPRTDAPESAPETRWTFGWMPKLRAEPFFVSAQSIGGELTKYPTVFQAHIGARTDCFTFAAKADESRIVNFSFRSGSPEKTILAMQTNPIFSF